jgi:hypothetical protein
MLLHDFGNIAMHEKPQRWVQTSKTNIGNLRIIEENNGGKNTIFGLLNIHVYPGTDPAAN